MMESLQTQLGENTQTGTGELYLSLMKLSLVNWFYGKQAIKNYPPQNWVERMMTRYFSKKGYKILKYKSLNDEMLIEGKAWPELSHTMIGLKRLGNLQACMEDILTKNVPGDFIETGVWRGGATIFMRAVLKSFGVTDRMIWVADSFEGCPPPDPVKYPADEGDRHHLYDALAVSIEEVKANFERYSLLDNQVRFLKGWFSETLPVAPIESLALMRLDGDLYESTMDALAVLYPKLSVGGYVIVDDYGHVPACRKAVTDYREKHGIRDKIKEIDWTGIYWRRNG